MYPYPVRDEAMARVYLSGGYSMRQIGVYFGGHYVTVSRAVVGKAARQWGPGLRWVHFCKI